MELRKSVSIVIPNYNGIHLLREYLPYTFESIENAGTQYEVIMVDDCSTDDSTTFIKTSYPQITLLINGENKGFSFSCNRGIEASKYELILLLNSDVKLSPDYFEHQWKYFMAWDTFGVMGRIIDMEGDHIQDAARVPKFNGLKLKTDYFYYTSDNDNRLLTFYLSGANALVNAAKLKELGGFNEIFSPFYCEDMELSIRAWRLKWKCYYEHQAVCRREFSASQKGKSNLIPENIYFSNNFYLFAIHLNGLALNIWYTLIIFTVVLPRFLTGKVWMWASCKELLNNNKNIREYKKRMKKLLDENDSQITIFNVVAKIRNSVKHKSVVRFRAERD